MGFLNYLWIDRKILLKICFGFHTWLNIKFLINFACLNSKGVCLLDSQRKNNLVFKQGMHFLVTFWPFLLVFWLKFHLEIIPLFCYSLTVNFVWNSHLIVDNYLTSNWLVSFERKKPNQLVGSVWFKIKKNINFGLVSFFSLKPNRTENNHP